jgi:hypothetical protein
MARPRLLCCRTHSVHGAARLHWLHADDCPYQPGVEIETKPTHPAGSALDGPPGVNVWRMHPQGCVCVYCVYVEMWLDRDDDVSDVEVEA